MATRRNLNGIASGLASSFATRNNDVDGYWALGKLCALAEDAEINLLTPEVHSHDSDHAAIAQHYSAWLRRQMAMNRVPMDRLLTAIVRVRFNVDVPATERPPQSTRGSIFECVLELRDDLGKTYVVRKLGWCAPHDPTREARSVRK